jgi:hypothetical protein
MNPGRWTLIVLALSSGAAFAQATATAPLPGAALLAQRAAHRFPQPVRVGDLIGRDVLRPVEAQPVLGHVAAVVRDKDAGLEIIVRFGGVLGIGARPIAVPIDAVALMGEFVAVMDYTPDQLNTFATDDGAADTPVAPDATIRVGIVKPFH